MQRQRFLRLLLIVSLVVVAQAFSPATQVARADGFIDFENGVDSQPIRSTIPGLQFTTTEGYDWVYGDWRTGEYNGPYPNGKYSSNGNFFAWLGPNQGAGRIDFTKGGATYIQVWVSSAGGLYADAYDGMNRLLGSTHVNPNLDTGSMARLRVDAPAGQKIAYVIFHDSGNYWLIDDLSTDAAGVPAQRPPVIVIPGLMGSQLNAYNFFTGSNGAVWPPLYDPNSKTIDLGNLRNIDWAIELLPMGMAKNGKDPSISLYKVYSEAVLDRVQTKAFGYPLGAPDLHYELLIRRLKDAGFRVYEYHYDWRLDVRSALHGKGVEDPAQNLYTYINWVLQDSGAQKVNIVAHSLGGLVTRAYVSAATANANRVEQAIILGTPYLGAPKTMAVMRAGHIWLDFFHIQIPALSGVISGLIQNYPSVYQILPSSRYWDVSQERWFSVNGNDLDWDQVQQLLKNNYNGGLAADAAELHQVVDAWNDLPGDVAFRFIVGTGVEGTTGQLIEQEQPWWDGGTRWDIIPTNGDGTVPLASASLQGNGVNYRGSVPIWYANGVDHGGLTRTDYVLDFVAAMLATPPNAQAMARAQQATPANLSADQQLYRGATATAAPYQRVTAPPVPPQMSEAPFPLDGAQVSVFQASALHLYDSVGRHTGPKPDGSIELGIPQSSYDLIGPGIFATVPAGSTYQVQVVPQEDQQFDFRVRDVQGLETHFIQRTLLYDGIEVGAVGSATLSVNPADIGATPMLNLDLNGDGQTDKQAPPTADLDAERSYDHQPPQTVIAAEGARNARGWYTGKVRVTITTTDSGTGVAGVKYTLDDGRTFNTYNGPFEVVAEVSPSITTDAFDRAGNHGTAHIRLIPVLNMLPSVSLGESLPLPTWRPAAGLDNRIVYDIGAADSRCSTLFAAASDGVYRSTDGGRNWQSLAVPGTSAAVAAVAPAFDGQASPDAGLKTTVSICPSDANMIYVGGWGSGIYRSTNGGNTWQPRIGGLSDLWVYDLAIHPTDCNVLYAATNSTGVFKTSNGGSSWQARNSGLANPLTRSLAIAPGNPNRLYVGTSSGVYRSDNGAASWTATGALPAAPVWTLAVARDRVDAIFAGVYGYGVYGSTGGGSTWQSRNAGLGNPKVRALTMDPLNTHTLYAGLEDGGGVYRSFNDADVWSALNDGFSNQTVKVLQQDGSSCRLLLAGTTNGVWYYGP